jgi:outer membrane protein assembly factor BamB
MFYVLTPVIALALASLFIHTLSRTSKHSSRYVNSLTALVTCALLVSLSACGSAGSQSSAQGGSIAKSTSTPSPAGKSSFASAPSQTRSDWTTYHYNNLRTGYIASESDPQKLTQAWNISLDGAVYAEPLVVNGRVIVATEGDSLYSLDAATGKTLWRTNVGAPVSRSTLPCGNIDPLGITGTPVYDPATKLIFAVAETTGPSHVMVGLDADTGQVKIRRQVDLPGMQPAVHQQRAALALNNGMVYFTYGGLAGDCGAYIGTVIGMQTDGKGSLLSYQVPTPREGGIWTPPGPVIDSNGSLYVSVGNGETTQGAWDHSDSVLRLSPKLQLEDGFAPQSWPDDNARDADLGSMGPVLLPNNLVFSAGKSGQGYLLHANNLGGVGGQIQQANACRSFGGAATIDSQAFLPCTDGVRQVKINANNTFSLGWQAPHAANGSPIIGGHTIYTVYLRGTLYALNSNDGTVRTQVSIPATSRFATPTLSSGRLFIGTMTGITAITKS